MVWTYSSAGSKMRSMRNHRPGRSIPRTVTEVEILLAGRDPGVTEGSKETHLGVSFTYVDFLTEFLDRGSQGKVTGIVGARDRQENERFLYPTRARPPHHPRSLQSRPPLLPAVPRRGRDRSLRRLGGGDHLRNYPKTLSSPGFYGGYTPFSDSYYGRISTAGRSRSYILRDEGDARHLAQSLLKRRASACAASGSRTASASAPTPRGWAGVGW